MQTPEDDWAHFGTSGTTWAPDPAVRAAWHRGRRWYAVWLIRVHDPAVLARRRMVARRLTGYLTEVPDTDAHVTVWVAGFPTVTPEHDDDVSRSGLDDVLRSLRADPPAPPRLSVAGVSAYRSSTSLRVLDPHGDLDRLRHRLSLPGPEIRFDAYRAHITVGTWSAAHPVGPLAEALAPLRDLPVLPLPTAGLDWVEFDATVVNGPLHTRHPVPWSTRP